MKTLFLTRTLHLFAFGLVSVFLVLYLADVGLSTVQIGALLTLTLVGDTLISLWIMTNADRLGRKKMLIAGSGLMMAAGVVFALTDNFWLLLAAATLGVISPSGNEVGPFLAIEQAALSGMVSAGNRTRVFAWYNLAGSFAVAAGAMASGALFSLMQHNGVSKLGCYRVLILAYAALGAAILLCFLTLQNIESAPASGKKLFFGLHSSRRIVFRLSALFSLDAFAGGFVMQSLLAYWFHVRFGAGEAELGAIFFAANILAGVSALSAARIAKRIGLVRTMVFTHITSNVLLIAVPFMPSFELAVVLMLLRFSISQMDVPTRQAYTMAVVSPDERSAAARVTGIARSTGSSLSPVISSAIMSNPLLVSVPLLLAGGLKIVYDLLLYRAFARSDGDKGKNETA